MTYFNLYCLLRETNKTLLRKMLGSLQSQEFEDWTLVLAVPSYAKVAGWLATQAEADPRIVLIPAIPGQRIERHIDEYLTPGTWQGVIDPDATLEPGTLELLHGILLDRPDAQICYTDEQSKNRWGLLSHRSAKGEVNGMRLRFQEYLKNFLLIRASWLQELGGYSKLATNNPAHDLCLRTYDRLGAGAFLYVPTPLYNNHRNHSERTRKHLPSSDIWGVRESIRRNGSMGVAVQLPDGCVRVSYSHLDAPLVLLLATVTDDIGECFPRILALVKNRIHPRLQIQLIYRGVDIGVLDQYRQLGKQWNFDTQMELGNPAIMRDRMIREADGVEYVALLDAEPLGITWLRELLDYCRQKDVAAVGAKIQFENRLTKPGVMGWKYEGWDWNTAGKNDALRVPHYTAAVSPACAMLDREAYLASAGFDTTYPTLYLMDYCFRQREEGKWSIQLPETRACLVNPATTGSSEVTLMNMNWEGWVDPFMEHASL